MWRKLWSYLHSRFAGRPMLARILWYLDPLSSTTKKNPLSWTPLAKLSGSAHEKITFLEATKWRTCRLYEQLDSDHIGRRIQELSSGGEGPGHTDKKNDFFSLTIQRGPISRKTILFKVPEGGGSTLFRVDPTFFLEGVGSVCLFQWKPVELVLCSHCSKMQ